LNASFRETTTTKEEVYKKKGAGAGDKREREKMEKGLCYNHDKRDQEGVK